MVFSEIKSLISGSKIDIAINEFYEYLSTNKMPQRNQLEKLKQNYYTLKRSNLSGEISTDDFLRSSNIISYALAELLAEVEKSHPSINNNDLTHSAKNNITDQSDDR